MTTWAVKDHNGQCLPDLRGSSRIEVGCRVLPARYEVFRLHVSASYRELFDRALQQVLEENRWQMVEIKRRKPPVRLRKWSATAMQPPRGSATRLRKDATPWTRVPAQAPPSFPLPFRDAETQTPVPSRRPLRSTGLERDPYPPVRRVPCHRAPLAARAGRRSSC
jgi:hypothetical protein